MATIIQDYTFFENGGLNAQGVLSILNGSILQLEVIGTNSFNLVIEAQMIQNDTLWYPIAIISDKEYSILSNITKEGLYKIDITGFSQIKITNNESGTVTCRGRVVSTND